MRTLIAIAGIAAALPSHADTLEVYRTIDAQGRATYTNVKPGHDDYDVMAVEYEPQPRAAISPAPLAPKSLPKTRAVLAAAASQGMLVGTRVLAYPSLRRLAATAGEPPAVRRHKASAALGVTLRIDPQLRSWSDPAEG